MNKLTILAKACSDENRLRIIALIQRESALCVCELCDSLELAQPLVSRHLRQLKQADVLVSYKQGKWTIYEITPKPSDILLAYLQALKSYEDTLPALIKCDIK